MYQNRVISDSLMLSVDSTNDFQRKTGTNWLYKSKKKWLPAKSDCSWSYYIDKNHQGKGYGHAVAELAVLILKAAEPDMMIKLATEASKQQESSGVIFLIRIQTASRNGWR